MTRFARQLALLIAGLCLTATGCATVEPPKTEIKDPVSVYLGDFGIHSALFLPHPDGRYVEYVFCDWEYTAEDKSSFANGVLALMGTSAGSAFGRQYHDKLPGVEEPILTRKPDSLQRVYAERTSVYELVEKLDRRWLDLADKQVIPPLRNKDGMEFVRDPTKYSVTNNCNHLTADSLRALGCDVSGVIVWSNFSVHSPAQPPAVARKPVPSGIATIGE